MPLYASNFAANSLSGTVKVSAGTANIRISVNPLAFEGNKQFVLKLRKDSVTGTVIATTPNISIADTTTFVSLTANTATVAEGNLVAFSLVTTNVINGAIVYYSVFPASANVTSDDFVANTGSAIITNNAALFTLQANTNFAPVDETGENFRVQLRTNDAATGNVVYTTSNVTILDTDKTYNILTFGAPSSTTTESSNITFTFSATNIPLGTTFYYETTGNATVTSNTGSFVLNSFSNTFTVSAGAVPGNSVREFTVRLRTGSASGPIVATSTSAYVIDSALAYTEATGGNQVFIDNGYKVHIFLSSNNFTISRAGSGNYANINYLAIGGGGSGGGMYQTGGAGAGGALLSNVLFNNNGTYTITIGSGAAGGQQFVEGTNGGNTIISGPGLSTITAFGGGGSAGFPVTTPSYPGGSGGGSPLGSTAPGIGAGTPGQGFPGGLAVGPAGRAGAGGGAGGAGQPGSTQANQGGIGILSSITGTSRGYAGGGGGGAYGNPVLAGGDAYAGYGGGGGGGYWGQFGPSTRLNAESGNVNTGGGGGGTERSGTGVGGSGGSGIVVLKYPFVESASYTSMTSNALYNTFIIEGDQIFFTLNTLNLANNTLLYYTTVGNVISSDFVSGNTGSFRSRANSTIFVLRSNTNIPTNEERYFQVQIRPDSVVDPVVLTGNVITIKDTALAPFAATGGTQTSANGYIIHTFTSSANITFNKPGNVEYLIVAGGGGGGYSSQAYPNRPYNNGGAGGGGGGLLQSTSSSVLAGNITVTVGGGGTTGGGGTGTPSSFNSITASGGGGGSSAGINASTGYGLGNYATPGGSGGGGTTYGGAGSGTPGQGYPGGGADGGGGGGGGAGGTGGTAQGSYNNKTGGTGGVGLSTNITGADVYYAGGGGGSGQTGGANSAGLGGGGGANTGGGGGSGPTAGGSGIVVIRYPQL